MNFFVIIHVLAAVLFLGPVAVAISLFPRYAKTLHNTPAEGSAQVVDLLHRISRLYGLLSLSVPLFGVAALFTTDGALKNGALHAAILLSVIAWALLYFYIIPNQRLMILNMDIIDPEDTPPSAKNIEKAKTLDFAKSAKMQSMTGGIFNLLWVICLVLMFVGS